MADLRQRLERLPHGHPSSPYHADGERKPPPPRLVHLELAPPVAETPVRAAQSYDTGPRPQESHTEAQAAADGRDGEVHRVPSGPPSGDNPHQGHPAPHLAPDGTWSWGTARLTRDQVRIAEDAYERFRAAEGRSLFGGYGGSGLTATLRGLEERLGHGKLAPDTEQRALLEPDAYRARFADMLRRHPDRAPEQLARRVPGVLGYVFIFEAEFYTDGIREVQDALELHGFQLQARRNSWGTSANRCVITIWRDPLSDVPFQVQFHTAASMEAQRLARTSAEIVNDPRIPPAEAASLRADLASAWAAVPAPPGNSDIGDYRRAGDASRR